MRNRSNENLCPRYPGRQWKQMFTFKGNKFDMYFRYRFSKREKGEYFLTSCVNNFSGKWGREWSEVKVGWQFPASFRKYFETNRIFSAALVYCDKGEYNQGPITRSLQLPYIRVTVFSQANLFLV